ncbi:transglutaminase family protein [Hahella sp. KA22]|uniref:transglutaminase family protein n=1 Tax=Hahella sp. KA22 TaxID=1628392 RepID=UPI000FDECDA2|nr:transglutaminase family protein [Hahella sp. KA22]AZZ94865.1 transglutaminase family protein [Hahella sp. KA22]QAY58238.1 transglutaminase family protein [Hahella sp. KA22]
MKRYKIGHETTYSFSGLVQLYPHTLRLRPREGHELRIESSRLDISPPATLRWHRDVEGNSVSVASFIDKVKRLRIYSEVLIQKYDLAPLDFLVADYAVDYPFHYLDEDRAVLAPYIDDACGADNVGLSDWINKLWRHGETVQTISLLLRLNHHIFQTIAYRKREEEGVQSAERTLYLGSGSCRDSANLFMASARRLGFAARFVSGYIYVNGMSMQVGSTHAWAEVFIPGAGWKGFDPTRGTIVGAEHIAVAVARLPESIPPIAGDFFGVPGSSMEVNVRVTDIT